MAAAAAQFKELTKKSYRDQAIWMLNGFWSTIGPEGAEKAWGWEIHFRKTELLGNERNGRDLDQFLSAKFLEDVDQAMSATERKEALKKIDTDSNGRMALLEYMVWKYNKTVEETVNASQGSNADLLAAAQAKLNAVARLIDELQPKLEAAQAAYAVVKAAEDEVAAAVADLKAQEDAYSSKCKELESAASAGGVKGGKASAELAQLKNEDPLPLRRAKITQEAALRKCEKARKEAEEPKRRLEEAYAELEAKMAEARTELEEVKRKGGPALGAIWWMERELYLSDESLPRARQKYDHSKPFQWTPPQ